MDLAGAGGASPAAPAASGSRRCMGVVGGQHVVNLSLRPSLYPGRPIPSPAFSSVAEELPQRGFSLHNPEKGSFSLRYHVFVGLICCLPCPVPRDLLCACPG